MACPVAAPIKRAGEKTPPKTPNPIQSVVNKILSPSKTRISFTLKSWFMKLKITSTPRPSTSG